MLKTTTYSFLLAMLLCFTSNSQTLVAGDIAFIGFNTDNQEGFSFITLNDIPGSEEIYFTDKGIINSSLWNTANEDHWRFTVPAGGISCGTIVSCVEVTTSSHVYTVSGASGATMVWVSGPTGTASINLGGGDQMLAYQSASGVPSTPAGATFIAGIHTDYQPGLCNDVASTWTLFSCVSATSESALPPGLMNGTNCVSFDSGSGRTAEFDNFKYNGTLTGTSTAIRLAINNPSNWIVNNSGSHGILPGDYSAPSVTCASACTDPSVPTISASASPICPSANSTLTISGTLNDATNWHIYTSSCGGTQIGTTASSTFVVNPSVTTTYFIRGEGGCVTSGSCGTVTVTVNAIPSTPTISAGGTTTFCAGGSVTLTSSSATGNQWSLNGTPIGGATNQNYTASAAGSYTVIVTTSGCASTASSATAITVNAIPSTPTISAGGATIFCAGGSVTLTSSSATGNQWSLNGTPIGGATSQTYAATGSGNYTVVVTTSGCVSAASSATGVTVNTIPSTPTISAGGATTFCTGSSVTLTSNSATGNQWSLNGTPIGGATSSTYAATGSGNYTVIVTTSGCASTASAATVVTVNTIPSTPTVSAGGTTTFCTGGSVILTSSSSTGNQWSLNGTPIGGATSSTYAATGSGNYTVIVTTSGCASTASAATVVTVNTIPSTPTVSAGGTTTFCTGGSVILTSSSSTGNQWSLNGTPIGGATSSTYAATAAGNYTVIVTTSGCASTASSAIGVTVNVIPSTPTISAGGATIFCAGGSVILTSSSATGNQWSLNGTPIGGATSQTYVATGSGNYTAIVTTSGCASVASAATSVAVNTIDDASFNYSSATFCLTGADPTPTITGLGSGGFTGSGGLTINSGTGEIDLSTTGVGGPFTVTYTTTGTCPNSSNVNVSITTAPNASFSYTGTPYCATGTATVAFGTGASAGGFTATPSGLTINSGSGEVDLVLSTAGTYTVINDIAAAGGCASATANSMITINAIPVITPTAIVNCDSISYDGMMYYTSTMVNDTAFGGSAAGCDSITNQQITINNTVVVIPTVMVGCDSLSYNGMMYYTSTMVNDTAFGAVNGCDSITNQQITINNSVINIRTVMAGCDSLAYNGMMYYISTMVSDTAFAGSVNGCDSITNQQINIDVIDVTVMNASPTLTANQSGATYQWLDCDNGNAAIPSETNQSYTATANGNYAVEVTLGACVDTSACENVNTVGIENSTFNAQHFSIYPNPTTGVFTIDLENVNENTSIAVYDVLGKVIVSKTSITTSTQIDLTEYEKGIYFINIQSDNEKTVRKIILQ